MTPTSVHPRIHNAFVRLHRALNCWPCHESLHLLSLIKASVYPGTLTTSPEVSSRGECGSLHPWHLRMRKQSSGPPHPVMLQTFNPWAKSPSPCRSKCSSHITFHPPLDSEVLWVPWIIIPYAVNNFAPNCGLPLRTIFCHHSGWQPAYTISKFHNFLTFSCSVTFFSTLFQPPSHDKPGL